MGFTDDVYRLAAQVSARQDACKGNEEATKHSLILPFFQMLGYDVHDPAVLKPEFGAGFASNKEKIDYAIFLKGEPALFVEAKAVGVQLGNHDAQLAKYFNATPGVKLAVITNGVHYKFFTDQKAANIMDEEPILEFAIEAIRPEEIEVLKGFRADSFDPAGIITQAENLGYLRALSRKFRTLFRDPSDEFVRFMCAEVFPKKITEKALERLTPLVRQAMSAVLVDMVSQGLSQEMAKPEDQSLDVPPQEMAVEAKVPSEKSVVTTEEELLAYEVVRKALETVVGSELKIGYKDTSSYFVIHADKQSRWFARLLFGPDRKAIALRIPAVQANSILGVEGKAEPYNQAADSCRVTLGNVNEIQGLSQVLAAAYRLSGNEFST